LKLKPHRCFVVSRRRRNTQKILDVMPTSWAMT
jgi:hypothetical protein